MRQESFLMIIARRRRLRKPTSRQSGFTLVEMIIGSMLLTLLMFGMFSIYTTMMRLCASVSSSAYVSSDAANAVQRVTNDLREAQNFELMDGTGGVDGTAFGTAYDAVNGSTHAVICVTGIRLFSPAVFQSQAVPPSGSPQGTVGVTINGRAGTIALVGAAAPWDHNAAGTTLDIYRASYKQKKPDGTPMADGTARPNDGACLWITGTEQGADLGTLPGRVIAGRPIVKNIAPAPNAVQFFQPLTNPADPTSQPLANAVQIKITCGQYDFNHNGATSSDAAFGGVSQLSGNCVYMRDHTPFSAVNTGVNGHTQN